ncbi:MAG TPA: class I SAM-dependent methyltransferase [Candidatus Sulfotelmatobacter sp.]|jgi:2-polyprenyl-3-methyl-5-hydroxy-6-metoxy-1,4-benzoquinol methylase|nr:class I SAM-dependent methyltransferase [Candidatus Sulfotelmatobacter sp.]
MKTSKKKITTRESFHNSITWPKKNLEIIICPLCNSPQYTILYPHFYPRVVICQKCSLVYTNPRLKESYLKELYTKDYFQNEHSAHYGYEDYIADSGKIKKTFEKRLNDIEKLKKPGNVLDVGCAMGFFMDVCVQHGWQVEGVEISEFAAEYVKNKLGYRIHTGDFQKVALPKETYDLITLWDVIEHVPDPVATLKKIYTLLKPGGMLVLTTPDAGSLPAKLTQHRWIGYKLSDEHLTYFSLKTLRNICEEAGLSIIRYHQVGKHVSYAMFTNRVALYNKLIGSALMHAGKVLPKDFSFYISAFDIICIYAVKKEK